MARASNKDAYFRYNRQKGPPWIDEIDGDPRLYIDFYHDLYSEFEPKEIEEIILEVDAVHETAVVGVEDEILGENIQAYVVLKPGQTASEKDIVAYCRRNLPVFKVPHKISILDELPKTSSGKIKKGDLKS